MSRVVDDGGLVLDATFSVEFRPLSLVFESAGGKTGVNPRNRDYGVALPIILRRLGEVGAVITDIRVDSVITRRQAADLKSIRLRRHALPVVMSEVVDFVDLKHDISTAAREPGARDDASRGGSSRRLRFLLSLPSPVDAGLEARLAGMGGIPDVDVVETIVQNAAGRSPGRGQGFLLDPVVKSLIEGHAMRRATEFYSASWTVKDVHRTSSYDLECTRGTDVLLVEVKGTTGRGEKVMVTRQEVRIARERHPHTELFIVSEIRIRDRGRPNARAEGGEELRIAGWGGDATRLEPLGYTYTTR